MRLDDWSQKAKVRTAAATTMKPFFQPSLAIRKATMATYRGIQTGMFENNAHIGSVRAEFQLLISRVAILSALSSVCQRGFILEHCFVVITREKNHCRFLYLNLPVESIPKQVLKFLDSFLSE
jgi:hypothetical protein